MYSLEIVSDLRNPCSTCGSIRTVIKHQFVRLRIDSRSMLVGE